MNSEQNLLEPEFFFLKTVGNPIFPWSDLVVFPAVPCQFLEIFVFSGIHDICD
jgi:hypothetical protein